MIIKSMSLSARKELLASVRQKYRDSDWMEKGQILDGFVAEQRALRLNEKSVLPINSAGGHRVSQIT